METSTEIEYENRNKQQKMPNEGYHANLQVLFEFSHPFVPFHSLTCIKD